MTGSNQPQRTGAPMGLLDTQPAQQPEQKKSGFWNNFAGGLLADPDRRAKIAIALEGMTLNPNQGLIQNLQSGIDTRKEQAVANRTTEWLAKQPNGQKYAELAAAAGPDVALRAYQTDATAASNPNVQSVMQLPDGGSVYYMRDGTTIVRNVSGQILSGQAAVDYVKQAQQYGVGLERDKNAGREEGKLGARVELGAAASAAGARGEQSIKLSGEFFNQANVVINSISNIDRAISAIDAGAQSGALANMLPDVTQASGELKSAINSLGLDVVAGATFGALSEGELNLAMATAAPQNLPPAELRSWLVARRAAQQKAASELYRAAAFFDKGGSPSQWIEQNPNNKLRDTSAPNPNTTNDQSGWIEGPNGTKIRKVN